MSKSIVFGIVTFALLVSASGARAQCTYGSPGLTNGTPADAAAVMTLFTALTTSCAPLASPNFTGIVGIGMTASNVLDITQNQNAVSIVQLLNNNGSTASRGALILSNGTTSGLLVHNGTGFTTSGIDRQNGTKLQGGGAGGVTINTGAAQPVYFGINSTEVARFGTDGSFLVGGTTNVGAASAFIGTKLFVGATADPSSSVPGALIGATAGKGYLMLGTNTTSSDTVVYVYNPNGQVGGAVASGSGTTWATSSDERLKDWKRVPQLDRRSSIQNLWVGDYDIYRDFSKTGTPTRAFGVRAQQAYKVLGGLGVTKPAKEDGKWMASSEPFAYLALWGVKDIYAELESLERKNVERDRVVSDLQNQNRILARQVRDLVAVVASHERINGQRLDKHADALRTRNAR